MNPNYKEFLCYLEHFSFPDFYRISICFFSFFDNLSVFYHKRVNNVKYT